MDSSPWEFVSDSAKDLIQQMLQVDPKQRITIQEVLNHRWLRVSSLIIYNFVRFTIVFFFDLCAGQRERVKNTPAGYR